MSECDYHAIKITISFPATPPESPSPLHNTNDVVVVPVSVAVVVVVIIVAIVVLFTTATIIVIKYKHLKLTTNPTQSDSPQEPPSSRCERVVLLVQRMLTLYIAIFYFVRSPII